jgi:tRNA nucleotidyltransferase/poly(A) polymerase
MSDPLHGLAPRPAPLAIEWPALLMALQPVLGGLSFPVLLVGGAVRDAMLRRPIHDLDFVALGDGRVPARRIADHFGGAYYPLDAERQVGRAIIEFDGGRYVIDVARGRGQTLLDDLRARDFTINAMAVTLTGDMQTLYDPLGGLADISKKVIRRCSPTAISDDPLRALRAIRQSAAFQMQIEKETRQDLRRDGPAIARASVERVRDEFMTMLGGPRPHAALRALDTLGLLALIVPEVDAMRGCTQSAPHVFDVLNHSLSVIEALDSILHTFSPQRTVESASNTADGMIVYLLDTFRAHVQDHLSHPLPNDRSVRALLMLAALLHDGGKPATRSVGDEGRVHFYRHEQVGEPLALERATALRLSNEECVRLAAIVRHHMRPVHLRQAAAIGTEGVPNVSRRAVYRFWNAAVGVVGVDVCLLTLADYLGMVGPTLTLHGWIEHIQIVRPLLDGYFLRRTEVVAPPPLVSGRDLMSELGLTPGPAVGRLLRAIMEAQATGEITSRDEALDLARRRLDAAPDGDEEE